MSAHLLFDLVAYIVAALMGLWARRAQDGRYQYPVPKTLSGGYLFALTNGAIIGSVVFGTLNLRLAGFEAGLGKSVIGAMAGAVLVAEVFKHFYKITGSTGALLVPGLAAGIAIGRWGCFMGGLEDYTYGIPSSVAFAVDFGDGVLRHPVQLYESFAMIIPVVISVRLVASGNVRWQRHGFYWFVLYYAGQRFLWETLKPYSELGLGLNLFQWLCLFLAIYAATMMRRQWR